MTPKIYIEPNSLFFNKVKWVINIIGQYARTKYHYVNEAAQSDVSIGSGSMYDIKIDLNFFKRIENDDTRWRSMLPNGPIYYDENGNKCSIETIFYLVNCIQELNLKPSDLDQYGRYKYSVSLQKHYGIVEENFVGHLIDQLILQFPILSLDGNPPKVKSKFFISHDIDLLLSGWKIEGFLALKQSKWSLLLKVLWDILRLKPFYNNIDQIILLDKNYGIPSCFYWLPKYGKDQNGIMNADYSLDDLKVQSQKVLDAGLDCGIHKSSFENTFGEEMAHFHFKVEHNRYHYLKFQTHKAWKEIEAAGLKTDASLGFAEHIGFRNSYGLPFVPFDMENDRPFSFVEIPMHVMDVTLKQYMGLDDEEISNKLQSFFIMNKENAICSILIHNNYYCKSQNSVLVMPRPNDALDEYTDVDDLYATFRGINY